MQPQKIASPSLQSKFLSPKLKKKKLDNTRKKGLSEAANLLQLYSGVDPNKNKKLEEKKEKNKKEENKDNNKDKTKQRPQRRVRIKLDNLVDKTPELSKNTFTFGKGDKNGENNNLNNNNVNNNNENNKDDEDDDLIDIKEDQCVQYEGYVYKYSHYQKKNEKNLF